MHYQHTGEPASPDDAQASAAADEDARAEALTAALTDWFRRHGDMRCFLAVDPSQRDLLGDDVEDKAPFDGLPRADVHVDHDAFPEAHRPYLLELDLSTREGRDALAQSVRIAFEDRRPDVMAGGLGQRVGGWLASHVPLDDVAAHWSRLALQRDDSGSVCLLRFYDSRALALLWPVLAPAQRQAMLGPVRAWHVLDAAAGPDVHLASAEARSNFMLSAAQWKQIHRHGLVNRSLALHAQACGRQPTPREIEAAVAAAARAADYGLTDREDAIAFIGHALAWHPHFDSHPKVAHLLGHKPADDFYTAAIAHLSAAEIDDIRLGAWYERSGARTPG